MRSRGSVGEASCCSRARQCSVLRVRLFLLLRSERPARRAHQRRWPPMPPASGRPGQRIPLVVVPERSRNSSPHRFLPRRIRDSSALAPETGSARVGCRAAGGGQRQRQRRREAGRRERRARGFRASFGQAVDSDGTQTLSPLASWASWTLLRFRRRCHHFHCQVLTCWAAAPNKCSEDNQYSYIVILRFKQLRVITMSKYAVYVDYN